VNGQRLTAMIKRADDIVRAALPDADPTEIDATRAAVLAALLASSLD